jgi:rsbT antagonist protein RsbS
MQQEVAAAMVQLGLTFEGITTALDLEEGLAYHDRDPCEVGKETRAGGR